MSRGGSGEGDEDISKHRNAKLSLMQRIGPLEVWLVDGRKIRNTVFIDFTEGGNSEAYKWMPQDPPEVWLDNANRSEFRFILLHELHEYNEMRLNGIGYEKAHDRANVVERRARRDPSLTEKLLAAEFSRVEPKEPRPSRYGAS